jgi:hypothetical protein
MVGRRVTALVLIAALGASSLCAEPCARADFEAAVAEPANILRELNAKNKPAFQTKLRQLKEKRGWSHDQFLEAAAPIVQDATISDLDQKSANYLELIQAMGTEGTAAKEPDCALLLVLRTHMRQLVDTQTAKWSYLFDKVERELWK